MSRRLAVAIEAAFILFAVCAIVGMLYLRAQHVKLPIIVAALSIPAIASVVVVILCAGITAIFPQPRISFPVTWTLPLLHGLIMLSIVRLALTMPNALETAPPQLMVATLWQNWKPLLLGILLQIIVLSLLALASKQRLKQTSATS